MPGGKADEGKQRKNRMKIYGIISEFNPFHTGHERIVAAAREMGADAVVGMRYSSASLMQGAAEVVVYGTAVKFV